MMCYRDTTFCDNADKCKNRNECSRWFSPAEKERATKWGGEHVPVAFMSFRDTCAKWEELK